MERFDIHHSNCGVRYDSRYWDVQIYSIQNHQLQQTLRVLMVKICSLFLSRSFINKKKVLWGWLGSKMFQMGPFKISTLNDIIMILSMKWNYINMCIYIYTHSCYVGFWIESIQNHSVCSNLVKSLDLILKSWLSNFQRRKTVVSWRKFTGKGPIHRFSKFSKSVRLTRCHKMSEKGVLLGDQRNHSTSSSLKSFWNRIALQIAHNPYIAAAKQKRELPQKPHNWWNVVFQPWNEGVNNDLEPRPRKLIFGGSLNRVPTSKI